ncbi:MAG: PHP domain-containing protein [Gemmatimonadales bacterium]|nr:PHP domain-containing protein [Gemmatimonadales bacterium]
MADPGAATVAPHVDLHAHSTASDGAASPADGVAAAHAAGLAAYALTDHDTLAGIPEAQRAADAVGLRLVPGVELSVHEGPLEIHLLGLHILAVAELQQRLVGIREHRRARAESIVARLASLGVPVTLEAVLHEAAGGSIGRPHVARALIAAGHVKDAREAFDRFLGAGRPAFVEKERLEVAEGIALIHQAGGIAVMAHPQAEGRRERIEPLVAHGLDGLEVRHPSHSNEDAKRIAALAEFFGLVPSGGSDWHGAMQGGRVLGAMKVPLAWLEAQDERVARRRAG